MLLDWAHLVMDSLLFMMLAGVADLHVGQSGEWVWDWNGSVAPKQPLISDEHTFAWMFRAFLDDFLP